MKRGNTPYTSTHNVYVYNVLLLTLLTSIFSCTAKKPPMPLSYQGPVKEIEGIETIYVEDNVVKMKMKAEKVFEFQNGDQEFPNGIHMEFYSHGKITSILDANKAYFFRKEKKWRGQNKVKVNNIENKNQLRTEELFWMIDKGKIYTDKFISIRMKDELVYGNGLDANQDLSEYTIKNPGGEFEIDN